MIEDRDTHRLLKQAQRDDKIHVLYTLNPRLKELDDELAAAGREGLLRAWEGSGIDHARQKITGLQEKREELLASLGLDESVYDVVWDCPLCQDRGYVRPGTPCVCTQRDDGDRRAAGSGLSPMQKMQTFETFSLQWYDHPEEVEKIVTQMKNVIRDLIAGALCGNLFLFGPVGNGKTHLCSAAANLALAQGNSVIYMRTETLVEALREDIYGRGDYTGRWDAQSREDRMDSVNQQAGASYGRGSLQNRLLQADLLILEDLGTERLTEFAQEQLTNLVDLRIQWHKPWIITSHLIGDKFTARYDPRLIDRILGEGKRLYLKEGSIRFKKAQKDAAQ